LADYRLLENLIDTGSDDAALALVRADLQESSEYKRDHWNHSSVDARWRAARGDPSAFDWGKLPDGPGIRPVNNLSFMQIRHKVGKLTHSPSRISVLKPVESLVPSEERLYLSAAKKRLEMKAREARWDQKRVSLAIAAAVQGVAHRAVGVQYDGVRPIIRTWRIRSPEWHQDCSAETLADATWCAWRRYVSSDEMLDTLQKIEQGVYGSDATLTAEPDYGVTLQDDQILLQATGWKRDRWLPKSRILVTDYWRKDDTVDLTYPCTACGKRATMGQYRTQRAVRPLLECQHCGNMEKRFPQRQDVRLRRRYPGGRHIKIVGQGTVVYNGPAKMQLRNVFPIIEHRWYELDEWPGMGEIEMLAAPQMENNIASAMTLDNSIYNAHPKRWELKDSLLNKDNNDPANTLQYSEAGAQAGGLHQLPPGDLGAAARIMLEKSEQNTYRLAGNDPVAAGAQPDTIRSGVGIARINAASDISLFLPQRGVFAADTQFFEILQDICKMVDYADRVQVPVEGGGVQSVMYERDMMKLIEEMEVTGEQEVEEQRETYFTRALQMKQLGDPTITWDLIHRLSGIPEEYFQEAESEVAAHPESAMPLPQPASAGAPGAAAPSLSVLPGGRAAPNQAGAALSGLLAPPQTRPPSRSRGTPTPGGP